MDCYYSSLQYIDDLQNYLNGVAPGSLIIPAKPNKDGKVPMFPHKNNSYTLEHFDIHKSKCMQNGALIILSRHIIVVDIDDHDWAYAMTQEIPEFAKTVSARTAKGMHFYFKATERSTQAGMKDGARQMKSPETGNVVPIDIKTACSTGTGGLISIVPSPNKEWVVEPMKNDILDIPDRFIELYQTHTNTSSCHNKTGTLTAGGCEINNKAVKPHKITYDLEEIKALIHILSPSRYNNYTDWINVGICLFNTDSSDTMLQVFIDFSRNSRHWKEGETPAYIKEKWRTFGLNEERSRFLTVGSLHAWAKNDNYYAYREVINKRVFDEIINCNGSHNAVASIAAKILRGKYVCASPKTNTWYRFDGTLWKQDGECIKMRNDISTLVREQIHTAYNNYVNKSLEAIKISQSDIASCSSSRAASCTFNESCSDKSQELFEKLSDIAFKLQDKRYKDNLVVEMKEFLSDIVFEERLDSQRHLLAFTNGVWDLLAKGFRPATPEDYLSISVGYEYDDDDDDIDQHRYKAMVSEYWQKLHSHPEQRAYIKKTLARQLYGDSGRELFHIHAGTGGSASNGKSCFWRIMEFALGQYVRKTQVSILTAKNREEASKPQPEYAYWRGVRFMYVSEPEHNECMHSGIVKDLTGGERLHYRQLYSNTYVAFIPQFKWHMMCNDPPKLDATDDGMKRRMRKIEYNSRFVPKHLVDEDNHMYAIDPTFMNEIEKNTKLRMAFLQDILDLFDKDYDFDMPDSIQKTCECYLKDNDGVAQFVEEFIVKSEDKGAYFTLKEAKELFQRQEYFNGRIGTLKTDLEKLLRTVCLELKRFGQKRERNVFIGFILTNSMYSESFNQDCM